MAPATSAGAFVQRGVCEVDNSDRRRLLSRALHLGYDMLSVDTDIIWTGDPYPSAASLPLDAAFATDVAPPMGKANDRDRAVIGKSTTSHLPLNSGFMLARPEAQRLFAEVARRLRHRLLQPPNRTVTDAPLPPLCPPLLSSPLPLAFPTSSAFPGSAALSPNRCRSLSLSSLSLHLSSAPLACRLAHH